MSGRMDHPDAKPPARGGGSAFSEATYRGIKRLSDVVLGGALLLVALPLMGVIAILIRRDSAGPILIRQIRVGLGGVGFTMLKFRTMRPGADEDLEDVLTRNPDLRLTWEQFQKLLHDPRLTAVGRGLRRYSLDELPQLWNVVRGEMSLVGPRPFLPEQRGFYGEAFDGYARVRPGMTGLWQISGRNRLSFEERVALDAVYLQRRSLWVDLVILARTIAVVARATGAF
jgi:lipopolysaccharide/colanic/teichoic acid biosynthesis glycosyltransferase